MPVSTATRPATPGQINFIKSLLADRDTERTAYHGWTPNWDNATFETASSAITFLKTLPYLPRQQAEPGYYVMADGTAIKVQQNKAKTGTYGLIWSGRSWDYAPGVGKTVVGLTPMTGEEAARLGLASGRCIVCCRTLGGETLTARVAALVGYGEKCAENNGWAFPKGTAAQRARIAQHERAVDFTRIQTENASRFD